VNRKTIAGALSALLVAGGLVFTASIPASATEVCVPSEAVPAWTEVVPDIEHPAVGEPTIVVDNPDYVPAVEEESHLEEEFAFKKDHPDSPRWEVAGWNADGNPQSEGWHATGNTRVVIDVPGSDAVGEPTITIDNPDYVAAYTEVVPDIEHAEIPAVVCEEDPEEPVTYDPSCTTVLDSYVIEGDGVISVPGGWESETISVPLAGVVTLADIGTVLDIQADPLQYVGLHIRTPEGSISFEEEPSYGGDLWSTSEWEGVEAGMGYAAFGSIEEYIEFNGDVSVTAIDLLYTHPEASTTTVESFTIGCTLYTFEPPVIVPEQPEDVVTVTEETFVNCDADTFTTVTTTTTISTVYDAQTNTWVPTEPVVQVASSERAATDQECPPEPVIPEEPVEPEEPSAPVDEPVDEEPTTGALAATGGGNPVPAGFLALGILALGLIATAVTRVRRTQ
jgi:hypothetical protein